MRLTQYTDYSLRVLIYLAVHGRELTTIQEITEAYGISRSHLMKVVQQLAREGYVEAIRGQGGGLRLRGEAAEINLGEVVRRMEPDFAFVECFREGSHCAIETACVLPAILHRARQAFLAELDRSTLADLAPRASSRKLVRLLGIDG